MVTGTLVPVEEYLHTCYEPDCDYLEGVLAERNVGQRDHSRTQLLLAKYFAVREELWGIKAFTELRLRVRERRYRIPDLCVVLGEMPDEPVFTTTPFLCVEILSPDDTVSALQERIDDYLQFGVRFVWLIDPQSRRGWVYTPGEIREAKDGVLRTAGPALEAPLAELFDPPRG